MSDIKDCFRSRFTNGKLVEIDYSQLEIIGLAVLSDDPVLKNDIQTGIDLHCQNTANLYGEQYHFVKSEYDRGDPAWTAKRKLVKAFSFQLQYGSGAKAMAASNGVHLRVAEDFIKAYYGRYKVIKQWQEENILKVRLNKLPTNIKSPKGYPICVSELRSDTGRIYKFKEYDSPDYLFDKGVNTSFSPTMIKNYPVQGFSTGDLVPLALGKLMRYILKNRLTRCVKLVNTIHDSVILDIDVDDIIDFNRLIMNLLHVMESLVPDINKFWPNINFDLPLKADASVGSNWGNMKDFNHNQ